MTKYPPVKTTLILNEVTQNQLDQIIIIKMTITLCMF